MRVASVLFLLLVLACSNDDSIVQRTRPPGSRPAAIAAPETTGIVHEVQMVGSIQTGFRFEPADISIKVGDTVRWINGSGLPHNVAFYADSIPLGAMEMIEAVMPAEGKLGPMIGRIVSESGDTFEMDFVNVPFGVYNYFSVVQESEGMVGTLTVEQ